MIVIKDTMGNKYAFNENEIRCYNVIDNYFNIFLTGDIDLHFPISQEEKLRLFDE